MTVRAVVFDAYGTLYDVQSVGRLATELCGDKGELITQLWRLKQLEYTWLRGLMQTYEDFSVVTRNSLDFALERVGVTSTPTICNSLMAKYLNLDLYPETLRALKALADYRLAILSNGSPAMLNSLVEASGVGSLFSEVISVDRVAILRRVRSISGRACRSSLFGLLRGGAERLGRFADARVAALTDLPRLLIDCAEIGNT